jgi:hypothetical protein
VLRSNHKKLACYLTTFVYAIILPLSGSANAGERGDKQAHRFRVTYREAEGQKPAQILNFSTLDESGRKIRQASKIRKMPAVWPEAGDAKAKNQSELYEFESSNYSEVIKHLATKGITTNDIGTFRAQSKKSDGSAEKQSASMTDEVRTLIDSGPAANRIDLVFMGDGYTEAEREKFHADINRLVDDMFLGTTFKSYLPVLNVHSVFRPSTDSGIGKGSPKNTAYRLYREGETLRAIFPGDASALRDSCGQAPDCDYPVVIANDPDYGGLGGEFAISTSSIQSGTVVLRHELGHNFGRVGEEYDGGGYFGANHSSEASQLSWRHWIPDGYRARPEPMFARFLGWPWHQFSKGEYTVKFRSDGKQARAAIRFSASGFDKSGYLRITLDGQVVPFRDPESSDRTFIDIDLPQGFGAGEHQLTFASAGNDSERKHHWLSSITVHEYANDFPEPEGLTSAFPVFNQSRSVAGYRPTNESCLMRNMLHPHFCDVCQENNWLKFLDRIEMIDKAGYSATQDGIISAEVTTLPLGQFRSLGEAPAGEKIEIKWFADGSELVQFRDSRDWQTPAAIKAKKLEVEVTLRSSEIRRDSRGSTSQRIEVPVSDNHAGAH